EMLLSAAGIALLASAVAVFYLRRRLGKTQMIATDPVFRALMVLLCASAVGAMAPTPLFIMYLYPLLSLLMLLIIRASAPLLHATDKERDVDSWILESLGELEHVARLEQGYDLWKQADAKSPDAATSGRAP